MSPTEAQTLLSPAPVKSQLPSRWADLGCGSGVFTLALAPLLQPDSTIYAVDRQQKIRPQTTPNHVSIEPVKADFTKIPLPFSNLETVVGAASPHSSSVATFASLGCLMANSLHYVKDKLTLIRTLRAVTLRPQHGFLIVEYDTDRATPVWVPHPVSFSSLGPLFQAAGYSTITRLADHPSIYNRNKIYAAYIA